MGISDIAKRLSETQTAAAINTVANADELISSGQALSTTLGSGLPLDGIEAPSFDSVPGAGVINALDSAGANSVAAFAGVVGQTGLQGAAEQVGGQFISLLETGANAIQEQIADGFAQIPADQIPALPEQQIVDGINQGAQALTEGLNQVPAGEIGAAVAQGAQALSDGIAQIADAINGGGNPGNPGGPGVPGTPTVPMSATEAAQAFVGAAPLEMIPEVGQQIENAIVAGAMQLDAALAGGGSAPELPELPALPETNLTPVLNALAAGDFGTVAVEGVALLNEIDLEGSVDELVVFAGGSGPNPLSTGTLGVAAQFDLNDLVFDQLVAAAQDPASVPEAFQAKAESIAAQLQALAAGAGTGGAPSFPMSATEAAQAFVDAAPLEMIPEVGAQIEGAILAGAAQLDAAIAGSSTPPSLPEAPAFPSSFAGAAQAFVDAAPLEMIPEVGAQIEDAILAGAAQLDAAIAGSSTPPSLPAAPAFPMSATEAAQAFVDAAPLEMIPEVGAQIEDAILAGAAQLDAAIAGSSTPPSLPAAPAFPSSFAGAAQAFVDAAPLEMIPEVGVQIEDAILAGAAQLDAAFAGAVAGGNPFEGAAEEFLAQLESGAGTLPISADAIQQQFAGFQDQLTGLLAV